MEQIILVDSNDRQIGTAEKMEAHRQGKLHRAFSIYVFNKNGELMLQKRHKQKYHSGGLWTNTACSHPRDGEPLTGAAHRRLEEEMGFDCELKEAFSFIYMVPMDKGLTEHEYLHVFIGKHESEPKINLEEAEGWKWMDFRKLQKDMGENPQHYTKWFLVTISRLTDFIAKNPL